MTLLSASLPWFLVILMTIVSCALLFTCFKLKKNNDGLKEEFAERDLLLNSVAEGVYGLDLDGKCTFCNQATLRLLGYKNEAELVGRNVHDLIHHTHANGSAYTAEDCKACLAYKRNEQVHLEDEVLWRSDGTSFQAEYWSYPVHRDNRLVGAVVSFVDITERKATEARIREANHELDAFVYTVSHDLRTPITAIIGYADLIKENHCANLTDDIVDHLTTIETLGQKMAVLVEDLLALAIAGKLQPPELPVDTNVELTHILDLLNEEIEANGATVIADKLPHIKVPGTLLGQIFQNLICNALRYAGESGSPIEVGGERLGRKVRIFVRDHGKGIPDVERNNIFEVFYRGSTGREFVGSGVGLATVQKIARLYGGKAWVEDTPGGGATFWVEMEA